MEHQRVPSEGGSTGHADVIIGDSHTMMGDAQEGFPAISCTLHLYLPETDAAYVRTLSAREVPVQEPADIYCGDPTAGVRDVSGDTWWPASWQKNLSAGGMQLPQAQSAH